jgi:hypothetical protein
MSSKPYAAYFKDSDPQVRIKAIKAAAKAVDRKSLKTLAVMVADDPDPAVREMARKAGVHIRQQLGDLPMRTTTKTGEALVAVKPGAEAMARSLTDSAVALQIGGENARGMKQLERALHHNPNLRHDAYFRSVADSLTGLHGDESIKMILDTRAQSDVADRESQQKRQTASDTHLKELEKSSAGGIIVDFILLFFVGTVAMFLGVFVISMNAGNFVTKLNDNHARVDDAIARGLTLEEEREENGVTVTYTRYLDHTDVDMGGKMARFDRMEADPAFLAKAETLAAMGVNNVLAIAAAVGMGLAAGVTLAAVFVHLIASALGGKGNLVYIMQRVPSFWVMRIGVLGVVVALGSLLPYELFGDVNGFYALAGVVAVLLLIFFIQLMSAVGRAYRCSPLIGLVAALPVMLLVGTIAAIGLTQLP